MGRVIQCVDRVLRQLATPDTDLEQYLVVTVGDARQSTPTVSKTVNPEWNVSFDLPIVGTQSLLLEATCWDRDRFGKDYLGEFDIAVEEIFANGQISQEVEHTNVMIDDDLY